MLPAALWGEKTGTFTNADRTVHISHKAVEPPGEAQSDMDIFLDYARRMDFRDKDGRPLIKWSTPEECFRGLEGVHAGDARATTRGLSYEKLRAAAASSGPATRGIPTGKERLYDDFIFPTHSRGLRDFGHDLDTGRPRSPADYKARTPGRQAC